MGTRGETAGFSASEIDRLHRTLDEFGLPRELAGNAHISRVAETNYDLRLRKGDLKVVTMPEDSMLENGLSNLNRKASKVKYNKGIPFQVVHYFTQEVR